MIFSALFSTPVPHGFEAKSKHRAENFLLLLYRNIQSKKVNTASKSFLKSPLFLYRNIERGFFNTKFKNTANTPLLSYRNIGGRNTTSIFESSQKIHKLVGFHGSKRKKNACLFFRSRRSFGNIQFYFISRISSSFTSSVGLPPASSLFRKTSIAVVSNRRSPAQSNKIRSLLFRPNMAAPQQ